MSAALRAPFLPTDIVTNGGEEGEENVLTRTESKPFELSPLVPTLGYRRLGTWGDDPKPSTPMHTVPGATLDPFVRGPQETIVEWDDLRVSSLKAFSSWCSAIAVAMPLFLLNYSSCVSYSMLIAVGSPLDANVITAMNMFSCGFTMIMLPLHGSCPLIVPSVDISITIFYQKVVQDVVLGAVAAGHISDEVAAATALLALPLNTLLMSLTFWMVGHYRATVVISYLPYAVIAGFLGSIGWAIFTGSFAVLVEGSSGAADAAKQAAFGHPCQLASAVAMVAASFIMRSTNLPQRIVAVGPMCAAFLLFWIVAVGAGSSMEDLQTSGWLFPSADPIPFWHVWAKQQPWLVDLNLLCPRFGTFVGLGIVLVLSLTLRIAGIEGSMGVVIDIDEEVRWTGIANIGAGLCGTLLGTHSPGLTTFNKEAGSTDGKAGRVTAVLTLGLWLSGLPVMNALPRFLLAGILMNLGFVMLLEWMWFARAKVGLPGLAVIYAQVISSALLGLLPSVAIGVAVACFSAQAQLMTMHVLKFHLSGRTVRSSFVRSEGENQALQRFKHKIEVLGLEGNLCEGPMIRLLQYVKKYVAQCKEIQYLIIDFRSCQAANASGCALISKLDKILADKGVDVLYTNAGAGMAERLISFGVSPSKIDNSSEEGQSFDCALRKFEDKLLRETGFTLEAGSFKTSMSKDKLVVGLASTLSISGESARRLAAAGEWHVMRAGQVLTRQGMLSERLYVGVEKQSAVMETMDVGQSVGPPHRLSVSELGALAGAECVLYNQRAQVTSTVSTAASHVFSISREALLKVIEEEPTLYAGVARTAAMQLLRRNDALRQAVETNKGGGWAGAYFDRVTASASACIEPSPMPIRRQYRRTNSIVRAASTWVKSRSTCSLEHDL